MKEIINDREILLEAVKKDGSALRYASEELKNDREIVLEAVKADGEETGLRGRRILGRTACIRYVDLPFLR